MLEGICWCSASPTLPQAAPGWWRHNTLLLSPLIPRGWGNWCGCGVSAQGGASAQMRSRTGVDSRSTTGFHPLLHAPPPDLLPRLFGVSPGSDLTVTTTFISCSLGEWCKGKHFLHPLHITYQGNCWISLLVFGFWCLQPLQYYALFSTLSLRNGRCKNSSSVDLLCSNHKLPACKTCAEDYEVEYLRLDLCSCLAYYKMCIKKA